MTLTSAQQTTTCGLPFDAPLAVFVLMGLSAMRRLRVELRPSIVWRTLTTHLIGAEARKGNCVAPILLTGQHLLADWEGGWPRDSDSQWKSYPLADILTTMAYFTDLFTVETYEAFLASDRTVSGFRETQTGMASRLNRGDKMLAYIKGLSRWAAVLEVVDGPFVDHTPLFVPKDDPFVVRFRVNGAPILTLNQLVPIRDDEVFRNLSFTRGKEGGYWLGR